MCGPGIEKQGLHRRGLSRKVIVMRNRRIILSVLLLAMSSAAPLAGAERAVRISYNPMPLNLPSIVLRQRGLLERELAPLGWRVEWVSNLQTGPLMSEAMAAGAMDIAAVMGETSAVVARAAGNDLVIIAPYSLAPKAFALAVQAEGGVTDLRGLLGKKVGLPVGTTAHYLLARALAAEGLSLDKVEVLNMAVPDAATALAAGQLAGAVLVEPVLTRLAAGGKIRVLRDGTGLIGGLTVTTVRGPFLRQNPQVVAAYRRALGRAGEVLASQPEEAIDLASQETKLPEELVRQIAVKYTFLDIPRDALHKELLAVIDFMADRKLIARRPGLDELVADPR